MHHAMCFIYLVPRAYNCLVAFKDEEMEIQKS